MLLDAAEALLEQEGFRVTAKATNGTDAMRMIAEEQADVVVLDLGLADFDGLDVMREIFTRHPATRVIVYSGTPSAERIEDALEAGAAAFVKKAGNPADLVSAIHQVTDGRSLFFPAADGRENPPEHAPVPAGLTKREADILAFIADGATNAAIARQLSVSEQTVKFHVSNIFRKLGVANRTAATRWARSQGLVSRQLRRAASPNRRTAAGVIRLAESRPDVDRRRRAAGARTG